MTIEGQFVLQWLQSRPLPTVFTLSPCYYHSCDFSLCNSQLKQLRSHWYWVFSGRVGIRRGFGLCLSLKYLSGFWFLRIWAVQPQNSVAMTDSSLASGYLKWSQIHMQIAVQRCHWNRDNKSSFEALKHWPQGAKLLSEVCRLVPRSLPHVPSLSPERWRITVSALFLAALSSSASASLRCQSFPGPGAWGGPVWVWCSSAAIHHSEQALFRLWQGWNLRLLPNATSSVYASGRRGHRALNKDGPSLPH